MRILVIGAGGVGSAAVGIADRRAFFEHLVVADYDPARVSSRAGPSRATRGSRAPASTPRPGAVVALIREHRVTHVLNAVDPRFVMPIFDACFAAGVTTSTWRCRCRTRTRAAVRAARREAGRRAVREGGASGRRAGRSRSSAWASSPGCPTCSRATRRTSCSARSTRSGVRDGANLAVDGYDFAPSFSIWTTIEECLNPPVIWEDGRGWFTTPPFSEPEVFDFPEGIGPVECVNVEHEEVLLIPRWVKAKRVTFKYGLGNEFIEVLRTLHKLGLDCDRAGAGEGRRGLAARRRGGVPAGPGRPRRPDARQDVRRDAGSPGGARTARPRQVYLYHVVDNAWTMAEYGSQAVVWQTAINPVVALELLARDVERRRRPRAGGVRAGAVPRPARRVRVAVGDARGDARRGGLIGRLGARARAPSVRARGSPGVPTGAH